MNYKYNNHDVGGDIVQDNAIYLLKDNKTLQNLVLSITKLYRGQSICEYSHDGKEKVYFFVQGTGIMDVESQRFRVSAGDVILVPDGEFRQVINDGEMNLVFNCVFNGQRNH